MPSATTRPAVMVIAAVAALAGGCKKEIDTADAEGQIKKWAEETVGPVSRVQCKHAEMKAGQSFTCDVTFVDGNATFALVVDQKDDHGSVLWDWKTPVGGGAKLAATATAWLAAHGQKDAQLDCGAAIQEIPPDGLRCKATIAGQTRDAIVKLDADNGMTVVLP